VLALIGLTAWLVRRFASNRLGGGSVRGRQPRLAVIDAANVDARRRLILIRRDNIEHLLMIGGPTDIVVEANIVRAGAAREAGREARMPAADNGWPLQPLNEPPARGRDEWTPPELPIRARSSEGLAGLSSEFSSRLAAPEVPPVPRREPRVVPPAPPPLDPAADQNLADMANQLEAALRGLPETRSPVTDTLAQAAAPKSPEPPRPPREIKMRVDPRIDAQTQAKPESRPEPRLELRPEPKLDMPDVKVEPRIEPKLEAKPDPKPRVVAETAKPELQLEAKPQPKPDALSRQDFYDNLEEEMASLLGRPPAKS
jgi:flagellar protein FliO/FliZ